jgi:hypothetical protein
MKISKVLFLSAALMQVSLIASASVQTVQTQLLTSGTIDLSSDTVTLPLYHGKLYDGRGLWYVLIDSSDETVAKTLGLVYAPALKNALTAPSTRSATQGSNGEWIFDHGTVDFSADRSIVPGDAPNLFPPKSATPGSAGSADYSPYVVSNGIVYNAPIIAFDVDAGIISYCGLNPTVDHSILHDKVVRICPEKNSVSLALSHGYASGEPLVYVSLESNDPVASAVEGATYTPALNELKTLGASLPLFAVVNGETGKTNPMRQGLDSALSGDGSPLNVLTGIPTLSSTPYTPLWDLHLVQWTDQAISSSQRSLLTSPQAFQAAFTAGQLTGFGGGALNSSGLLVNCPALAILE